MTRGDGRYGGENILFVGNEGRKDDDNLQISLTAEPGECYNVITLVTRPRPPPWSPSQGDYPLPALGTGPPL